MIHCSKCAAVPVKDAREALNAQWQLINDQWICPSHRKPSEWDDGMKIFDEWMEMLSDRKKSKNFVWRTNPTNRRQGERWK